jgi:hypothetical protein
LTTKNRYFGVPYKTRPPQRRLKHFHDAPDEPALAHADVLVMSALRQKRSFRELAGRPMVRRSSYLWCEQPLRRIVRSAMSFAIEQRACPSILAKFGMVSHNPTARNSDSDLILQARLQDRIDRVRRTDAAGAMGQSNGATMRRST